MVRLDAVMSRFLDRLMKSAAGCLEIHSHSGRPPVVTRLTSGPPAGGAGRAAPSCPDVWEGRLSLSIPPGLSGRTVASRRGWRAATMGRRRSILKGFLASVAADVTGPARPSTDGGRTEIHPPGSGLVTGTPNWTAYVVALVLVSHRTRFVRGFGCRR